MARDFDPSAAQQRTIALFGLTFDGTHAGAKAVLTAAGLPENGIPAGLTPAKAKKLSDDEIRAAFGVQVADAATASATGTAAIQAHRAERNAESAAYWRRSQEIRAEQNAYARGEYVPAEREWFYEAGGKVWEGE